MTAWFYSACLWQNNNASPSVRNLASSVSAPFCFLAFLPGPRFTLLVGSNFLPMTSSYTGTLKRRETWDQTATMPACTGFSHCLRCMFCSLDGVHLPGNRLTHSQISVWRSNMEPRWDLMFEDSLLWHLVHFVQYLGDLWCSLYTVQQAEEIRAIIPKTVTHIILRHTYVIHIYSTVYRHDPYFGNEVCLKQGDDSYQKLWSL